MDNERGQWVEMEVTVNCAIQQIDGDGRVDSLLRAEIKKSKHTIDCLPHSQRLDQRSHAQTSESARNGLSVSDRLC